MALRPFDILPARRTEIPEGTCVTDPCLVTASCLYISASTVVDPSGPVTLTFPDLNLIADENEGVLLGPVTTGTAACYRLTREHTWVGRAERDRLLSKSVWSSDPFE